MADDSRTTIAEKSGGNGAAYFIGFVLLIAVLIGGYYLLNQSRNDDLKTDAVTSAAKDVGQGAKKAGDAVEKAAE